MPECPQGPFGTLSSEIDMQRTQHPSLCLWLQALKIELWLSLFLTKLTLAWEIDVATSPHGSSPAWHRSPFRESIMRLVSAGLHTLKCWNCALIETSVCKEGDKSPSWVVFHGSARRLLSSAWLKEGFH